MKASQYKVIQVSLALALINIGCSKADAPPNRGQSAKLPLNNVAKSGDAGNAESADHTDRSAGNSLSGTNNKSPSGLSSDASINPYASFAPIDVSYTKRLVVSATMRNMQTAPQTTANVSYVQDSSGRFTKRTTQVSDGRWSETAVQSFAYDVSGNLITYSLSNNWSYGPGSSNSSTESIAYEYDSSRRLTKISSKMGGTKTYQYLQDGKYIIESDIDTFTNAPGHVIEWDLGNRQTIERSKCDLLNHSAGGAGGPNSDPSCHANLDYVLTTNYAFMDFVQPDDLTRFVYLCNFSMAGGIMPCSGNPNIQTGGIALLPFGIQKEIGPNGFAKEEAVDTVCSLIDAHTVSCPTTTFTYTKDHFNGSIGYRKIVIKNTPSIISASVNALQMLISEIYGSTASGSASSNVSYTYDASGANLTDFVYTSGGQTSSQEHYTYK